MPAELSTLIEQYRHLSKDFGHDTRPMITMFDQQVPQFGNFSQETDFKPQIKNDIEEALSIMESIIRNDSTTDTTTTRQYVNHYTTNNENNFNTGSQFISNPGSTVSSSTSPSYYSSSSSTVVSSTDTMPSSTCSTFGTVVRSSPDFLTRDSICIPELGESGRFLVSSPDYFIESESTNPPSPPEYTDMDELQVSMFSSYHPISEMSKPGVMVDESRRLEEAAIFMRDTIRKDSDNLKVPYDPMMWTQEHVRKWVSWVCQRNNVPDASPQFYSFDGPTLCSMNLDTFTFVCGDSGIKICNELDLWKAANSCFSILHNNDMVSYESQIFSFPQPCTSPALSSCSSTPDSNDTSSPHLDHSDEEATFGSHMLPNSITVMLGASDHCNKLPKIPSGRGHKQTIRLWQFLKELLLSKDCNYSDCIRWIDRKAGVFKIEDSKKVATMWGARKNRPAMNYDKLSRSVRQYYKKGIIKKTDQSKRLVYQFCAEYL